MHTRLSSSDVAANYKLRVSIAKIETVCRAVCIAKRCGSKDSDSDNELDVSGARQVCYEERGNVPGLSVRRGCTRSSVSWTPVKPSPISSQTRAKLKY